MELAAAKELVNSRKAASGTKRKRRWDVPEPADENVDPNKTDKNEWSKEALEASAPKKCCSCWDATLAEALLAPLLASMLIMLASMLITFMVVPSNHKKGVVMRPKCTKEQRTLGKEKTAGMWADIATERENYVNKATELASKYEITCIWMSKQLYMGAKQLVVRRKANAFNKAIKCKANRRREQGESLGRDGLAIIARDLSATGTWHNEESDEETSSSEEEIPIHVKKVTAKTIANEIECTMTRVVDPQVFDFFLTY
ncbi:hypothetical protein F4604DRAFT_2005324 [Suillus subluteus]|nr:hypothetical protein F4604DRAFT_2005324 [Suillus subluteus]